MAVGLVIMMQLYPELGFEKVLVPLFPVILTALLEVCLCSHHRPPRSLASSILLNAAPAASSSSPMSHVGLALLGVVLGLEQLLGTGGDGAEDAVQQPGAPDGERRQLRGGHHVALVGREVHPRGAVRVADPLPNDPDDGRNLVEVPVVLWSNVPHFVDQGERDRWEIVMLHVSESAEVRILPPLGASIRHGGLMSVLGHGQVLYDPEPKVRVSESTQRKP
mmetsp:Transcript_21210/g.41184  ORF Transcript_21210/g.41184 Transcript_21210/m.41184 type:complete len:221 (-) Transcript_21210:600-1262(-)